MKPITQENEIQHFRLLAREMMLHEELKESDFEPHWVVTNKWKVVPVESAMRLPAEDIPRLAEVLNNAGYCKCIALLNEPGYMEGAVQTNELASAYQVDLSQEGLAEFNRVLGLFRCLLLPEDRSWGVSCGESFNLFGANPRLLEQLLGKSIYEAREDFYAFAKLLSNGEVDSPLMSIANRYAGL